MKKTLIVTSVLAVFALTGCQTTAQSAKKSTTSVVKKTQTATQSQAKQQAQQAVQTAKTQVVDQAKAQADAAAQAQAELARKIELSRQQAQAEADRLNALVRQEAEQARARTAQQRTNANQTQYMYMCNMGATVKAVYNANNETAMLNVYAPILNLGNQDLSLKLAPSASGALYTNGNYEWHTNGGTGVFSAKGSSHQLKCEGTAMP